MKNEYGKYDKIDHLTEVLGSEIVFNDLLKGLSTEKLNELADYIAKNHNIDFDINQEEEELEK